MAPKMLVPKQRTAKTIVVAACVVLLAACATDDPSASPTCGDGTELREGVCFNTRTITVTCAEGTELDTTTGTCVSTRSCGPGTVETETGECRSEAECGPGTLLDLTTGQCIPEAECGSGTVFDPESGACVSVAACGPGTVFDGPSGECRAIADPCLEGSTFNPLSGLCESSLACDDDQIDAGGVCVPNNEALVGEADGEEGAPDLNDPAFAGAPEAFALEIIGERAVLLGTIGRPTDLDGDNDDDQDVDVWSFSGSRGQLLRIEVVSLGAPQPWFEVRGPSSYRREAPLGWVTLAGREILLPYDGTYEVSVVPAAYRLAGAQLGGPEARYALVVTELALPSIADVTPGAFGTPAQRTGELMDLTDNFTGILSPARSPVELTLSATGVDARPVLLVFNRDLTLVSEIIVDVAATRRHGTFVGAQDGSFVVVDWQSAAGPDNTFTLDLVGVPLVELGSLPATGSTLSAPIDVAGNAAVAFSFTPVNPSVLDLAIGVLADPDVFVFVDGVYRRTFLDTDGFQILGDGGEMIFFAINDTATNRVAVTLMATASAAYDVGILDPAAPTGASYAGDYLDFINNDTERRWFLTRLSAEGFVTYEADVDWGDAEAIVDVYDRWGERLRYQDRSTLDRIVYVPAPPGEPVLAYLSADSGIGVLDWSMLVSATLPAQDLDVEPNDLLIEAVEISGVPTLVRGNLGAMTDDAVDVYLLTLPVPLGAEEQLRVRVDHILDTSTFGPTSLLRVYDENGTYLTSFTKPDTGSFAGVYGTSNVAFIPGFAGDGPFLIEIARSGTTAIIDYVLTVEASSLQHEREPNGSDIDADLIPAIPGVAYGIMNTSTDTDVWSFALDEVLPAATAVRMRLRPWEVNNNTTLTLESPFATVLATSTAVFPALLRQDLTAGTYYLRSIHSSSSTAPGYSVEVDLVTGWETEPNDDTTTAGNLGELSTGSLRIDGLAVSGNPDVFTFTLPAPLEADESIRVKTWTLGSSTVHTVRLYAGGNPSVDPQLAFDANWINTIYGTSATTTWSVQVTSAVAAGLPYRLFVNRGPRAEIEPNGTSGTAHALGAPPQSIIGTIDQTTADLDAYSFVIADPLTANQAIRVRTRNIPDASNIQVSLRQPDFTTVIGFQNARNASVTSPVSLGAGTYYVVVTQPTTSTGSDNYELTVEVIDVP